MRTRAVAIVAMIVLVQHGSRGQDIAYAAADAFTRPAAPVPDTSGAFTATDANLIKAKSLLAELRGCQFDEKRQLTEDEAARFPLRQRGRVQVGRDVMRLGRSAVPLLIEALNDSDPNVSAVAALALGRIGDRRAVEPLLKVLQSFLPLPKGHASTPAPGHLRAQACVWALGQLHEPRGVALILALEPLQTDRSELIERLGFQKDSWDYMCGIMPIVCGDAIQQIGPAAAPELVHLLSDPDERTRAAAATYLGRFGVRDDDFQGELLLIAENRHHEDESDEARQRRIAAERVIADRVAALAGEKLIALLKDKDTEVRQAAATALGNLRIASARGPLMESLNDEHHGMRLHAVRSLGQLGDAAALDALAPLLKKPDDELNGAAEYAVGMIGGERALALLKADLKSTAPARREAAIKGLSRLGTPEVVDLLIAALSDPDYSVRFQATEALAAYEGPEVSRAVEPLIAATHDEDSSVRGGALSALRWIGAPQSVDAAIASLEDSTFTVRTSALDVLGAVKDARSAEAVKPLLNDWHFAVRHDALETLAKLNPPDLEDCIRPSLNDPNTDIRSAVVGIFRRLKSVQTARSLEALAAAARSDEAAVVRLGALAALVETADRRSVETAIAAVKDPDGLVRGQALRLLGRMKDPRSVEIVKAALTDSDDSVRCSAMEALAELNPPDLRETLQPMLGRALAALQDPNEKIRAEALGVLGAIKDRTSADAIKGTLTDSDDEVRWHAVVALAKLNPPGLREALQPMLEDDDPEVRDVAQQTLRWLSKGSRNGTAGR